MHSRSPASRRGPSRALRSAARTPSPSAPLPAAAILIPLALLLLLRIAAVALPGTWGWGLTATRFIAPASGWALLALAALALLPPVATAVARASAPLDRRIASRPLPFALLGALLAAALAFTLADRATFIGDFQMREQAIESGQFARFLPESMPFDALIHDRLPRALAGLGLAPAAFARILGAIEAGLLALFALALARGPASRSARSTDASPPLFWLALPLVLGVPFAVFTGFPKPTADLCVLTLAAAALGVRVARGERAHLALGLVLALAILDHRSGLVLLPAAAYLVAARTAARDPAAALVALAAPPLLALAAMAPTLDRIVTTYDVPMHLAQAGVPRAPLPIRALDVANAILLVAHALVALAALRGTPRSAAERTERRFLVVLALAFLPVALLVQPRQGLFRDWEILAPAGIAAGALIARALAARIEAKQAAPALAVALAFAVGTPALGLLIESHSVAGALPRAHALLAGPPERTVIERTFLWDYVSGREMALGHWRQASEAIEHVAAIKPDRGVLLSWGFAATSAGDFASAQRAFGRLVSASPDDAAGIAGLGGAAAHLGDAATTSEMRARLAPALADSRKRAALAQLLHDHPTLWPLLADSLAAAR